MTGASNPLAPGLVITSSAITHRGAERPLPGEGVSARGRQPRNSSPGATYRYWSKFQNSDQEPACRAIGTGGRMMRGSCPSET